MRNTHFFGGALWLGLALTAPAAHAQFSKISEQEEIQAGRQTAAQAQQQYGRALPASDPRQQRVSRIGALFAAQAERKGIPYSYTVLQNDTVLNAFAAPGGPVFVTTKLIATTSNDAELAYVLGHETGHIERKHIVNAIAKQQKVGLAAGLLGTILSRGRAGNLAAAATNVTYTLWQKGFSREQESDADTYGVRAMARLGFDPRAAVSMLGKLGDGPEGLGKYLSDHPDSRKRQQDVSALIERERLQNLAQTAGGARLNLTGGDAANIYRYWSGAGASSAGASSARAGNSDSLDLGAPLQVISGGEGRVVLAPVAALARYAGGSARVSGQNSVVVSRGNASLTMQVGSTSATLNGRRVRLSVAPRVIGRVFYAPMGSVAAGLGGSASYASNNSAVRVEFDGRSGYLALP